MDLYFNKSVVSVRGFPSPPVLGFFGTCVLLRMQF